jgi:hypothetical protein
MPNIVGSIPVTDHLACDLGQVTLLRLPRPLRDVKPRLLVPDCLCQGGASKKSHIGGKCVTCCGLPFFNIAEVGITGGLNGAK